MRERDAWSEVDEDGHEVRRRTPGSRLGHFLSLVAVTFLVGTTPAAAQPSGGGAYPDLTAHQLGILATFRPTDSDWWLSEDSHEWTQRLRERINNHYYAASSEQDFVSRILGDADLFWVEPGIVRDKTGEIQYVEVGFWAKARPDLFFWHELAWNYLAYLKETAGKQPGSPAQTGELTGFLKAAAGYTVTAREAQMLLTRLEDTVSAVQPAYGDIYAASRDRNREGTGVAGLSEPYTLDRMAREDARFRWAWNQHVRSTFSGQGLVGADATYSTFVEAVAATGIRNSNFMRLIFRSFADRQTNIDWIEGARLEALARENGGGR